MDIAEKLRDESYIARNTLSGQAGSVYQQLGVMDVRVTM